MRKTLYLMALVLVAASSCSSSDSNEEMGASVAESVIEAWATGDQADIDAIYSEEVRMVIDDETLAENREEITSVITGAMAFGNTYEQVGPVAVYLAEDGDLYVSTLVEVVGAGHPVGDPVVGFYRVRDGKVIRHVLVDAEHF
jgi:ketosteroid isomerase-like protein